MRRTVLNRLLLPIGVLLVYFLVPVGGQNAPVGVLVGALVAILGLGWVAWVIIDEVQRADKRLTPAHLLLALELVVVIFALVYFMVAIRSPEEFIGLSTRMDALYFSLTTVATVGYGDISAAGQLGRLIVSVQLVFNLAFVAALVGLFQGSVRLRGGRTRNPTGSEED